MCGGHRVSTVREQQQRGWCEVRRRGCTGGTSLQHSSLPPTPLGRFQVLRHPNQPTNAYPLKGAKSGNNLLFSFIRREIKPFRHLPSALEDSVAKWTTTLNYTPCLSGTQQQRPKDYDREHSYGSARTGPTHNFTGLDWTISLLAEPQCCGTMERYVPLTEVSEIRDSYDIACHVDFLTY